MTAIAVPDERLVERGWQAIFTDDLLNYDFRYRRPGTYGWFNARAAWHYEADLEAGVVAQQYPTELMPIS